MQNKKVEYKMGNNKFKKVCINNSMCYYFDYIIKLENSDLDNIAIDKSHENILIYNISYKTLTGSKSLRIRFDKIDGIKRSYDGTRLTLFGTKEYDAIYNRIRYYFAKIKADSYESLLIEKTLFLHNVIILINSVLNKDKNN